MLSLLFGSKSVETILLFLLVHESCYANEIHKILGIPLTPLQKALVRLEKGGIVKSQSAGKTKVFKMNPDYPYLIELEALLQKAYAGLPVAEKRRFYFLRDQPGEEADVLHLWKELRNVTLLSYNARTLSSTHPDERKGSAEVSVTEQESGSLLFSEEGSWKGPSHQEFHFSNQFRWSLNRLEAMISLEHLRYGPGNPVFLFHLVPKGKGLFESLGAHCCGEDTYFGSLLCQKHSLKLTWRILGPKKNQEMEYVYSFD